jgi:hypothetical protein
LEGGLNPYIYVYDNPVMYSDPSGLKSYRCERPIKGLPGKKGRKNGSESPSNPVNHEYVCVFRGGEWHCDSTQPGKWGAGKRNPDVFKEEYCDSFYPDSDCVDSCLINKMEGGRPWYGPLPATPGGIDCQEWSEDALFTCLTECKGKR